MQGLLVIMVLVRTTIYTSGKRRFMAMAHCHVSLPTNGMAAEGGWDNAHLPPDFPRLLLLRSLS